MRLTWFKSWVSLYFYNNMKILNRLLIFLLIIAGFAGSVLFFRKIFDSTEKVTFETSNCEVSTERKTLPKEIIANSTIIEKKQSIPTEQKTDPYIKNLRLLGVVQGNKSYAFIEDILANKQGIYMIGDNIRMFSIVEIYEDEVILAKDDQRVTLVLDRTYQANDNPAITPVSENEMWVDRVSIIKEMNTVNMATMVSQVSITPWINEASGTMLGFKIDKVPHGSIIEQAGVEDGDVINSVNGERIESFQKAIEVFNKLGVDKDIFVKLIRDGKFKTIRYRFR
ncbi:MAG: hypothetical protein ABH952_10475 [Candidatus Omnitrophota bacterium]